MYPAVIKLHFVPGMRYASHVPRNDYAFHSCHVAQQLVDGSIGGAYAYLLNHDAVSGERVVILGIHFLKFIRFGIR
ncbi:hypothetical protein D3C77_430900 [compost metagenome]